MSNEPKVGTGLDPELLAAYIDQRLSPEQRAAVEVQLAADPDSHAVLVETMKAADDLKVPEVPQVPGVPGVRWAIAGGLLAAAAAVALVVWTQPDLLRRLRGGNTADPLMARLVEAVGEQRYLEPRLSGGFKYGPLRPITRGPESVRNLALESAAADLAASTEQAPTPEGLHAFGVARLLLGSYDEAVFVLEKVAQGPDATGRIHADLAAAYITRATMARTGDDLTAAGNHIATALRLDPAMVEARYSAALIAEWSRPAPEAVAAWREYLKYETSTEWRDEVEGRIRRLGGSR